MLFFSSSRIDWDTETRESPSCQRFNGFFYHDVHEDSHQGHGGVEKTELTLQHKSRGQSLILFFECFHFLAETMLGYCTFKRKANLTFKIRGFCVGLNLLAVAGNLFSEDQQ